MLRADGRAGDLEVVTAGRQGDADEVRVVVDATKRCSDTSIPRSAAMTGALTYVTVSSTRSWNRPFSAATVNNLVSCSESGPWTATTTRDGHADASAIASRPSFAARGTNGPRTSSSPGSTTGMLTAVCTISPSRAAAICSAMTRPARSCASVVEPARCGVTTICSSSRSGPAYGSSSNTSSAAPATFPSGSPQRAPPRRAVRRGPRSRSALRRASVRTPLRPAGAASRRSVAGGA